jgi:elongation factor Tu
MDKEIKVPERDINKPFLLSIEGTYHIAGRGTVATGTVDTGKVKIGDEIEIVGYNPKSVKTTVTGIETFRKQLDSGEAGDNIGLLIRSLNREDIRRG